MAAEFRETPAILRRHSQHLTQPIAELVAAIRRKPPQVVVTCARGSSAHAATFGKHLIERHLGIPVSAVAPNIVTVYGRRIQLAGHLRVETKRSLTLSYCQSWRGPTESAS